ncbi:MAG TPA: hypothetical protein PLK12_15735 [Prolixibacteraceae bacterium]|nr:hypothetical protein [Prolixibacteraceae bacterium]
MKVKNIPIYLFVIFLLSGLIVNIKFFKYNNPDEDIYYIYRDCKSIVDGQNPYSSVKSGNMRSNDKYATYFPLFYLQGAGMYALGLKDYNNWLIAWRILQMLVFSAISLLVFQQLFQHINGWAALFGVLFWQFHAYTLYVLKVAQIDFLAIFFLLLALIYSEKRLKLALLFFGISLAVKQIAIFLVPLFFLIVLRQKHDWKKALGVSLLYGGLVPFVTSLPFLIWDPIGFLKSVFFSATRHPASHLGTQSIDALFCMEGIISVLPMLVVMGFVYYLFIKDFLSKYFSSFLLLAVFVGFNSVLFKQYLVWPLLLIPFMIIEFYQNRKGSA